MKVYLAARFSRLPELIEYKYDLETYDGIAVTSRWLLGGHEFVGIPDDEIAIEHQAQFARDDLEDIEAADMVVCFTEPSRSGPARGGRHVEYGYALARGKDILIVGHRENVFYCLPDADFAPDWRSARAFLNRWKVQRLAVAS